MPAYAKVATAALVARSPLNWAQCAENRVSNTLSSLGTSEAPRLPRYLVGNDGSYDYPWGSYTASNTNYYDTTPDTGVTRYFDWTITKDSCAPDGVNLTCLLANGQFPGPTITANWGDWIEVKVTNNIPDEGTALHWHGILQKGTPWEDGTPGISQCPIAPGATFTYRFRADLYGTSWWHSHYSSQYGSGLVGPMIIHGPNNADYDEDLGPIMVSDWTHRYYQTVVDALLAPLPATNIPRSDNNLINGKNSFDCTNTTLPCVPNAPLAIFNFISGKTYRLRFINPSTAATQKITIDNHSFTVIANDFVPIEPYDTDVLTLAVGQRTDVIVKATGASTDAVWLRAHKPPVCWPSNGGNEVKAAIFYQNASHTRAPNSTAGTNAYNTYCGNDDLSETKPYYAITPPEADVVQVMPLAFRSNGTNLLWYMANRTFRVDHNDPMLPNAMQGDLDFPEIQNVHNYGGNGSLLFVVENRGRQPHPMHMHGHNIFVLAQGACTSNTSVSGNSTGKYGACWDGTVTNPSNPQRRDVHMLLAGEFIAVQWKQDNPGVWPFHCHIAWHLSAGFSWNIVEQPDKLQQMEKSGNIADGCSTWDAWTDDHVVDEIDDGL